MGYFVEAIDNEGRTWIAKYNTRKSEIQDMFDAGEAEFGGNPVRLIKIASDRNHHICKYCGGIAEEKYDDLLCGECREIFGHTLFSQL